MATDKKYSVVGITEFNGNYKVRFGNSILRIKTLHNEGHKDIRLCELDEPMLKVDGVRAIKKLPEFADVVAQSTIDEWLEVHAPKYQVTAQKSTDAVAEPAHEVEDENEPF